VLSFIVTVRFRWVVVYGPFPGSEGAWWGPGSVAKHVAKGMHTGGRWRKE